MCPRHLQKIKAVIPLVHNIFEEVITVSGKYNTAPIRGNVWSENWIGILSGMPWRINRAVKSCNRGAFSHFVCYYSLHTFSSSWLCICCSIQQTDMGFFPVTVSRQLLCFCRAGCFLERFPLLSLACLTSFPQIPGCCAKGWRGSPFFSVCCKDESDKVSLISSALHFIQLLFYPSGNFLCGDGAAS